MSLLIFFALTFGVPLVLARWSQRSKNILLGWDMLGSAVTGGRPGTTLSGRTGSHVIAGDWKGKIFGPIINFIMGSKTHCVDAIKGDEGRAMAVLSDYAKPPPQGTTT